MSNIKGDLPYADAVGHLAASLLNAQTTIRFMDTKAAAVIAFVTTIFGVIGVIGAWLLKIVETEKNQFISWVPANGIQVAFVFCLISFAIYLFFAGRVVFFAFECISPRTPGSTPPTILFPYWDSVGRENMAAKFKEFQECSSIAFAREEYVHQIGQLGEIVKRKIDSSGKAMKTLKWFALSAVCFLCSSLLVFGAQHGLFG